MKKHLLPVKSEYSDAAIEFALTQQRINWMPDEIKVDKDIHDIRVNLTEAEAHGVNTTLKLFTLYEMFAGDEYWLGRFRRMFDDADMHRMASVFGMVELAVHSPFYRKLNEALHLDNEEFYMSYVQDPVLKSRMDFIGEMIDHEDDLISLAAFSIIEGAILYSSFAFLKHFQSQGKNKMMNIVRGINFSVRDENIHSLAGAWAFKMKLAKANLTEAAMQALEMLIRKIINIMRDHEFRIIEMIFEKGNIPGITVKQMQHFVESRLNLCLDQLGFAKEYEVEYNPIKDWFYKAIQGFKMNDFFTGIGESYTRDWSEHSFTFKEYMKHE